MSERKSDHVINNFILIVLAIQVFTPKGKEGEVEVTVKVAGYNQKVLDAAQIKDAVSTRFVHFYFYNCVLSNHILRIIEERLTLQMCLQNVQRLLKKIVP